MSPGNPSLQSDPPDNLSLPSLKRATDDSSRADERAFRAYFRNRNLRVTRTGLGFAVLLISAICVVDWVSMDPAHASRVVPLRLGLMLLPVLVALVVSWVDALRHHVISTVTVAAFLCGVGTFANSFVAAAMHEPVVLWGNIFFTFFVYLLLGLPFRHSVVAASPIFLISVGFGLAFDTSIHKIAYVFFSQLIGMYTSYRLEQDAREIYRNTMRLGEQSRTDALTKVYNRRMLEEFLPRAWRQARRDEKSVGILLVDIDFFKNYNDHYGHQAGDDCICRIASALEGSVQRPLDFVARYGGEEFVVVLYAPTADYFKTFAKQLCGRIEALNLPHAESEVSDRVTISAGATLFYPNGQVEPDAALAKVDAALYLAKERGRNRVVFDREEAASVPVAAA